MDITFPTDEVINYDRLSEILNNLSLEQMEKCIQESWREKYLKDKQQSIEYKFCLCDSTVSEGSIFFIIVYDTDNYTGSDPLDEFFTFSNLCCRLYLFNDDNSLSFRGERFGLGVKDLTASRLSLRPSAFNRMKRFMLGLLAREKARTNSN